MTPRFVLNGTVAARPTYARSRSIRCPINFLPGQAVEPAAAVRGPLVVGVRGIISSGSLVIVAIDIVGLAISRWAFGHWDYRCAGL
jgi:hypothetical protein